MNTLKVSKCYNRGMELQPLGAYAAPLIKLYLLLFGIATIIGIMSQSFNTFISLIIFQFLCIGVPYAIYKKLVYNNFKYNSSQEKITIESGILSKNTIAILYNLIQNVNVNEPILLRFFGLAKIQFSTSSDALEVVLLKEEALSLQNLITSKMSINRVGVIDQKAA